jgi:acetyltransferase-like isoleucine patch superfamily enzyme
MPHRPLRTITLPAAGEAAYARWLGELSDQLADPACDRDRLCRDTLLALWYPDVTDYDERVADPRAPAATRAALLALDPRHVTLEPEHYHEIDPARYARVKPLLWLWQGFDRSPAGGGHVELGVRLRRLLAGHVFARVGRNFKCFQHVEFSFGYNIEVGDDVVIHRHVLLDDRERIVLGDRVSIADYANVYTHSHDLVDPENVSSTPVVLANGVRITYHATLLEGVEVGEQGMVGALAVATRRVRPYHVHLGIPAVPKLIKPNAPPDATEPGA